MFFEVQAKRRAIMTIILITRDGAEDKKSCSQRTETLISLEDPPTQTDTEFQLNANQIRAEQADQTGSEQDPPFNMHQQAWIKKDSLI